jgi:hypothetical protein
MSSTGIPMLAHQQVKTTRYPGPGRSIVKRARWAKMSSLAYGFFALLVMNVSRSALADDRVALVVGNSNYKRAPTLRNPVNDAEDVAERLRVLGFRLVGNGAQLNVKRAQLARAIRELGTSGRTGDTLLFYFAGHGVAFGGDNWLLPIDDDDIQAQEDVPSFAVSSRCRSHSTREEGQSSESCVPDVSRRICAPSQWSCRRAASGCAEPNLGKQILRGPIPNESPPWPAVPVARKTRDRSVHSRRAGDVATSRLLDGVDRDLPQAFGCPGVEGICGDAKGARNTGSNDGCFVAVFEVTSADALKQR